MPCISSRQYSSHKNEIKNYSLSNMLASSLMLTTISETSTNSTSATSGVDSLSSSMSREWSNCSIDNEIPNTLQSSRLRGWGSCGSRKAYSCLSDLATSQENNGMDYERPTSRRSSLRSYDSVETKEEEDVDIWGFFVDSTDPFQ